MNEDINDDLKDLEALFENEFIDKPMRLRVFDKNDYGDYVDADFGHRIDHRDVEQFVEWKTLTHTELAAEYWCEIGEALFWDPRLGRLHPEQSKKYKNAKERSELLLRAANGPDYGDEPDED